ncbi:unnamed protein product [Effrenium voratum]|nr:unnamed protein product [Effrenium voratum]
MDSKNVVTIGLTQDKDPLAPGFAFNIPFGDGNCLLLLDLDLQQQKDWISGDLDRNGFPVLRQPEVEDVLKVMRCRGLGANVRVKPGSVRWLTHFRVNSRQAEHYGRGRVFLAGDACHCHSPLGGQGMNMGFQDAKNLAWKLALAIKCGGPTSSLLQSYESERMALEKKLLGLIERGQEVVSSRNPVVFFLRGRGQRLANTLTFLQPAALSFLAQQAWSYRKSPLSMEHWERPIIFTCSPCTICPFGGYRRRQNLHRWLATRVHAGDRVPDLLLPGGRHLHQVLKKSRGWTLLLFEGSVVHNEDMEKFLRHKVLSFEDLQAFGERFKGQADGTNFVAMVDEVVCIPAANLEANHTFGVHGQCLFLVRPDHHVGFRCEPLREGAVYRYFRQGCGISHGKSEDVASVDSNDAALVTAKKAKFQDFDKANPGDVRSHPTLRLKGQLRARELVELRKMVEGDERFALLLDRHTKAVQELIVNKNSAPVLAMLAGLVWSSLCIAWELDTSHMPKARMKMEVEQLRIKLHKVVEDLSDSRAKYLKELTAHRDKLRHFESLAVAEVRRLIWEEEPVMFYEPIHYLDETTREHVAEITEEKLKLLLKRLQMSVPDDVKTLVAEVDLPQRSRSRQRAKTTALEKLQEFPDIAEEAEELKEKAVSLARREREADQREVRLKNQMEEMRAARRKAEGELTTRLEEEEARHSKTQMLAAEFKAQHLQSQAELSSIVKTLRHEWQELAAGASEAPDLDACALLTQFLRLQSQVLEPKKGSGEKELKEVTRLQGEVVQAQQLQARAEWQLNQLQAENQQLQEKVQQLKAQAEAVSDSCPHCGRKKGEASVTPVNISFQAEPSDQEVKASAEVDKEPVAHGALRAEPSHQQESAISASAAKAPSEVKASAEVDKEPVAPPMEH